MKASALKNIFNEFDHKCNYLTHTELNSGHINDTFLVNTEEDRPWETKATTGVTTRSDDNGTASINQTAAMGTLIAERVQTVITTSV